MYLVADEVIMLSILCLLVLIGFWGLFRVLESNFIVSVHEKSVIFGHQLRVISFLRSHMLRY